MCILSSGTSFAFLSGHTGRGAISRMLRWPTCRIVGVLLAGLIVLGTSQRAAASTIYEFFATDTSGATGLLEFDTTSQTVSDFVGLVPIAGTFDFDGPGGLFITFDVFDISSEDTPTETIGTEPWSATAGIVDAGRLINETLLDGATTGVEDVTLVLTDRSARCGAAVQTRSCGSQDPAALLSLVSVEGQWRLRQVPEPLPLTLLATALMAMAGWRRTSRHAHPSNHSHAGAKRRAGRAGV